MRRFLKKQGIRRFLLCLLLAMYSCNKDRGKIVDPPYKPESKKWTFLFYCDEDYTPSFERFYAFMDAMGSGDNLNVLVLRDPYAGPAHLYYINPDHTKETLQELGEANMGSSTTMHNFLSYAKPKHTKNRRQFHPSGNWSHDHKRAKREPVSCAQEAVQ